MPWAKVDDGWWCHPKVMPLSPAARGVWISVLSWSCQQRSPKVPPHLLAMVGGSNDEANALASVGLWEADGEGWVIHDWADYQDRSLSEKRAEAGRKGGQASGRSRRGGSNDEANAEQEPKQVPGPSRPDPSITPPTPPDAVVAVIADRLLADAMANGGRSRTALRPGILAGARTDFTARAAALLASEPTLTAGQAADRLLRRSVPLDQSTNPTVVQARLRAERAAGTPVEPVASSETAAGAAADAKAALERARRRSA